MVRKKSNFDGNPINQKMYGIEDIVNLVLERMKKLAMGQNIQRQAFGTQNTRSFNQTN